MSWRLAGTVANELAPWIAGGAIGGAISRGIYRDKTERANLEKFEQLRQMGLSQKDLQQVALAMGLPSTVLEPVQYV